MLSATLTLAYQAPFFGPESGKLSPGCHVQCRYDSYEDYLRLLDIGTVFMYVIPKLRFFTVQ